MTSKVEEIARKVEALGDAERDEFLSWLAEFEARQYDVWDADIAQDSQPGGRLRPMIERARRDIEEGNTRPLDEVLNDS